MKLGETEANTLLWLATRAIDDPEHAPWYIAKAYWLGTGCITPEQALAPPPGPPDLKVVKNEDRAPDTVEERLQEMESLRGGPANDGPA